MRIVISLILYTGLLAGCGGHKKIEITTEYIINPHWNDVVNAIKIEKYRLKEGAVFPDLNNVSQQELLANLERDTSFLFVGNVKPNGESYSSRKVWFNKDNGFPWWPKPFEKSQPVIGNLQPGSWYKFSDMFTYPYYVYVYVDSSNKVHDYGVDRSNY